MWGLHGLWARTIFSLLLAVVLWLSVKLIRNYSTTFLVPVRYVNIPHTLRSAKPLPTHIQVGVSGIGHQLLLPSLRAVNDSLTLDVGPSLRLGYVSSLQLIQKIEEFLPGQLQVERILPDTLPLVFEEKAYKRVPVLTDLHIVPKEGYRVVQPILIQPDSVLLTGTRTELDKVQHWRTQHIELIDAEAPVILQAPTLQSTSINISPAQVSVNVNVLKFTEGRIKLPVHIEGNGTNYVRLMPAEAMVTFWVPFDLYEKVSPGDFEVVVNLAQASANAHVLRPVLRRKPSFVQEVRIHPASITFVTGESPR